MLYTSCPTAIRSARKTRLGDGGRSAADKSDTEPLSSDNRFTALQQRPVHETPQSPNRLSARNVIYGHFPRASRKQFAYRQSTKSDWTHCSTVAIQQTSSLSLKQRCKNRKLRWSYTDMLQLVSNTHLVAQSPSAGQEYLIAAVNLA